MRQKADSQSARSKTVKRVYGGDILPNHFIQELVSGPIQTLTVDEGVILYRQCVNESNGSKYGLIYGYQYSEWRTLRGTLGRVCTVQPLTVFGRKKYEERFRNLLEGPLNFWSTTL